MSETLSGLAKWQVLPCLPSHEREKLSGREWNFIKTDFSVMTDDKTISNAHFLGFDKSLPLDYLSSEPYAIEVGTCNSTQILDIVFSSGEPLELGYDSLSEVLPNLFEVC